MDKRPPLAFFYPLRSFLASVLSSFPVHTLHISVPSPLDVLSLPKIDGLLLAYQERKAAHREARALRADDSRVYARLLVASYGAKLLRELGNQLST